MGANKNNFTIFSILLLILFVLVLMPFSYAATIHGTIYDVILDKESNVFVEINTIPKQTFVAKTGEYSFNVPKGIYSIYAYTDYSSVQEKIYVETETGDYQIDLVLSDKIEDPIDFNLNDNVSVSSGGLIEKDQLLWVIIAVAALLLIVLGIIIYVIIKGKKEQEQNKHEIHSIKEELKTSNEKTDEQNKAPEEEHTKKVLNYIKHEKQTTQKDVRKQVPLSEAKVSLIISDLEDRGKIRKIKKGRGNIIIFVKE